MEHKPLQNLSGLQHSPSDQKDEETSNFWDGKVQGLEKDCCVFAGYDIEGKIDTFLDSKFKKN